MFVITGPKSDNVDEGFALFCIHEVIMASEKQGNIKREHGIEKDFFWNLSIGFRLPYAA